MDIFQFTEEGFDLSSRWLTKPKLQIEKNAQTPPNELGRFFISVNLFDFLYILAI